MSLADKIENAAREQHTTLCFVGQWLRSQPEEVNTALEAYLTPDSSGRRRPVAVLFKLCQEDGLPASATSFNRHCTQRTCSCYANRADS